MSFLSGRTVGVGMKIVVVGLHIDEDGKLLIQERLPTQKRGGLWEFPGGKVEGGETMREALRHEWMEELGLEIEVGPLITETVIEFPEGLALLPLFRVFYDPNRNPYPKEGQKIDRATLDEAMALPGVPSMVRYQPVLRDYLGEHLTGRGWPKGNDQCGDPYPKTDKGNALARLMSVPASIGLLPRGFKVHHDGEAGPCVRCGRSANTTNAKDEWEHHEIRCPFPKESERR